MLAAIYGAIFSAQRLTRPVQDLIAGTRAVGKGDFGTRLPLPSRDEMGFLVHSFNDMTKRLRRAREEATRSHAGRGAASARASPILLARLSTGVLAVDRMLTVRIANTAAGAILGTDLSAATGRTLPELAADNERLGQFVAALAVRFAAGREEWREQIDLDGASSRRTLMCACTPLPGATAATSATSSCSTTSPRCCRRSATPPGAKWRAASRTRSRIRSRRSSSPPSACAAASSPP